MIDLSHIFCLKRKVKPEPNSSGISDCRQSPRLFAEDFSVLKRLKVSIFKTFQSLFGIIKVSKKAVLFYDDTRNRKSKKANADGMY